MKVIKSNKSLNKVHLYCVYMTGTNTTQPELRNIAIDGSDLKSVLMQFASDTYLSYLGFDFDEPDSFSDQELLDAIMYNNENVGEFDYIFKLEINGDIVINNLVNMDC